MRLLATALLAALAAPSAFASAYWTDWTGAAANSVSGTLTVGSTNVNVEYSGPYSGAQTAGGTNYWVGANVYTSATVPNGPPDSDIIQLTAGGTKTITFSQSVSNPLIGLVSWNGNTANFGAPISVLSNGCGFWGCGTPVINGTGTGFFGSGEVHGVIQLLGDYTSITFTDTNEGWHGITVGVLGLTADPVTGTIPEPTSLALIGGALAALAAARRKR